MMPVLNTKSMRSIRLIEKYKQAKTRLAGSIDAQESGPSNAQSKVQFGRAKKKNGIDIQ